MASMSPPLSSNSGTLEHPHNFEPIKLEDICTPEPTIEVKPISCNAPIVNTQPNPSTPKLVIHLILYLITSK